LEVQVNQLITDSLRTIIVPSNVEAVAQFEEVLPKIRTDPLLLKRVLVNLATNALQAMPNGGKLTVRAGHDKAANKLVLTVEDTGVGIPLEVQSKIFTLYLLRRRRGKGLVWRWLSG
jgi:signal transduction histidine kinase